MVSTTSVSPSHFPTEYPYQVGSGSSGSLRPSIQISRIVCCPSKNIRILPGMWMISKGQMTNRMRGKPIGEHFKMGSFPPGAALGPYPGLLASYFASPQDVSGGKLSPGPWPPPPGANCQTPDRSCGSIWPAVLD